MLNIHSTQYAFCLSMWMYICGHIYTQGREKERNHVGSSFYVSSFGLRAFQIFSFNKRILMSISIPSEQRKLRLKAVR